MNTKGSEYNNLFLSLEYILELANPISKEDIKLNLGKNLID